MDDQPHEEGLQDARPLTLAQAHALWSVVKSLGEAVYHLDRARDGLLLIETGAGTPRAASSIDVLYHAARSLLHEAGQSLVRLRGSADPEIVGFVTTILDHLHGPAAVAKEPAT